jgi:hypothetical protein
LEQKLFNRSISELFALIERSLGKKRWTVRVVGGQMAIQVVVSGTKMTILLELYIIRQK